jgi:V/A-type H+/Na+-transporting ATPase subunit A
VAVSVGRVRRVNGPAVEVDDLVAGMLELVEVGEARLPGEVIALDGNVATVQVYAYTGGVRPGDPVSGTGHPLRAELGPARGRLRRHAAPALRGRRDVA